MDSRVSGATPLAGTRMIAGSGRSGTTWLQDAIAQANGLRPVFEPLHPRVSALGAQFAHRALASDETHPELVRFLLDVCSGKRERFWTQYRCQRSFIMPRIADFHSYESASALAYRWQKLLADAPSLAKVSFRRKPLVKCIWSNLMLGWLSRQCGFQIVLLLRHPAAVVESELRNAWSAQSVLSRLRADRQLHELTNDRYLRLLQRPLTPIEELTTLWVIENQCSIAAAQESGIAVVFYEQLRAMEKPAWGKVRNALDLWHIPDERMLLKPSQQSAVIGSDGIGDGSRAAKWHIALTSDDKMRVQAILDETNFKHYSVSESMPLTPSSNAGPAS